MCTTNDSLARGEPEPADDERVDDDDHFHDECGVFGIWGSTEAANHTYLGLHALQHRGQEAAGIVSSDGVQVYAHRALGLVQDIFGASTLAQLPGDRAIGHVRYSTAGGSHIKNAQPIAIDYAHGSIAVAHNGNLTNADETSPAHQIGSIFQTSIDTELWCLIARSRESHVAAWPRAAQPGAFSLMVLTPSDVIAVRPLVLSRRHGSLKDSQCSVQPFAFELIAAEGARLERGRDGW